MTDIVINWASDNMGIALSIFTAIGGIIGFIANFSLKFVIETNKMKTDKKKLDQQEKSLHHQIETDKKKLDQQKESLHHQMIIVRQQMITNNIAPMRQAWINDLRIKISEFSMLAKMLRSFLYINFGTNKELNYNQIQKTMEEVNNLYFQLNALSTYLDLLLPFSVEGEDRKEVHADKLRENILKVVSDLSELMFMIKSESVKPNPDEQKLVEKANSILKLIEKIPEISKNLLLQEWRETKSLKELE